jgi:exopolyphosphatase / guanosine-5'-triphosphate,3'-diphosphate pyrophosphatase
MRAVRYGAVDVGSNSCRLLIADLDQYRQLSPVWREMESTRIGEGMHRSTSLLDSAMDKTVACLARFSRKMEEMEVDRRRVVATSAVREASNRAEFQTRVKMECGLELEIISGEEEARLSFLGVSRGLKLATPPLVVDLGGGSTEIIFPDQHILLSIALGAVRAAEAKMEVAQIRASLKELTCFRDRLKTHPLVMVGGAPSSMVAIKKGMVDYRREMIHGERLTFGEIGDLYELLVSLPLEIRRRLPGLQPERADIIDKGALIILIIMEVLGKNELIVSESDILEGMIWSMAEAYS